MVSTKANFLMLSLLGVRGVCWLCGMMRVGAVQSAYSALSRKKEKEGSVVSGSYKGKVSQGGQTGQLCRVAGRIGRMSSHEWPLIWQLESPW